jgi:hypothetical protein
VPVDTIDVYIADGPEPLWVLILTVLVKYGAVWLGTKMPLPRAAAATVVMIVASTIVGVAAEFLLPSGALFGLPTFVVVIVAVAVATVTETLVVGYGFARGVTPRIAAFLVAANIISIAASWASL